MLRWRSKCEARTWCSESAKNVECVTIYQGFEGWLKSSEPFPVEWMENLGGAGDTMTANIALFGLSLWAQESASSHDEGEVEVQHVCGSPTKTDSMIVVMRFQTILHHSR